MGENAHRELAVTLFTPWRTRCGIRDYSSYLLTALNSLPGIATRIVEAPADAVCTGLLPALRDYRRAERRFTALGSEMNDISPENPAAIAHVQHQYFFFGGVAPHKTHIRAFLKAVRVPLIMTVHEIAQENGSAAQRFAVQLANRINFNHPAIQRLIVHTDADKQEMLRIGVPPEKVLTVRHGIPPALPMPESLEAKRAWNLEGKRVITLFGFLSNKKGHRIALEAMPLLPPDIVLLFAGDQHPDDHTGYVRELRAEIARRNLTDRVRITGYLEDDEIPQIMALTDAALAPFVRSSGSGSLANLFAYGRAIIASDIAPHREILSESADVMHLFPTENPERLANAVLQTLKERELQERLERGAREYAARHSYLEMARKTATIYRELRVH